MIVGALYGPQTERERPFYQQDTERQRCPKKATESKWTCWHDLLEGTVHLEDYISSFIGAARD